MPYANKEDKRKEQARLRYISLGGGGFMGKKKSKGGGKKKC